MTWDASADEIERLFPDANVHLSDRSLYAGYKGEPRYAVVKFQGFAGDLILGEGNTPEEAVKNAKQWSFKELPR